MFRPQWFRVQGIRLRVRAFSAADPSSIDGPVVGRAAGLAADPEAIRSAAAPADLPEPQGSSLADRGQSIQHARRRAAMQDLVDRADPEVQAHVRDLAHGLDLADRRVLDLEHVLAQGVRRQPVKLHARNALPTNAPAAALHSIRRPRKAQ